MSSSRALSARFLARDDIGGLNVTIPYKRDVMAHCDALDVAAREIGSVNTVVRGADGAKNRVQYGRIRADVSCARRRYFVCRKESRYFWQRRRLADRAVCGEAERRKRGCSDLAQRCGKL
jgi:hypothetical protein